jgi:hypothetical protein
VEFVSAVVLKKVAMIPAYLCAAKAYFAQIGEFIAVFTLRESLKGERILGLQRYASVADGT